ncbi:MAG: O-antigen ligase family protein [Ignavibacteria bacterium]
MKNSRYKAEFMVLFYVVLAGTLLINKNLSVAYSIIMVIYGLYRIMKNKNRDGAAHIMAGYIISVEVLFRMASGGFGYEYGKYAGILLLVMGILVGSKKKKIPYAYVVLILALIPSIFYVDFPTFDLSRQMVSFNISGPIFLGISAIYFYKRNIPIVQLRKLFLSILCPIVGMTVYIYFHSANLEEVKFTTESNFQASGGFGPNQVSTIFGLGILIIAASYFLNIRLFRIKYLNIILLMIFLVRGLATFSRGGMLAPLLAIILCIIVMTVTDAGFQLRMNRIVYAFLVICVVGFVGFNYVNDISGGLLEMRYKGESMYDKDRSNLLSGRDELFKEDLEVFKKNVLTGVGPGMASSARAEMGGLEAAAHIEYSRLLAEHGLFGVIAIGIIVLVPISTFFKLKSTDDKILLIMCTAFVFVTLGHAAMRTAAPSFIYGMAFIHIIRPKT